MADSAAVRREIEERNRGFVAAFNRGDAAGVAGGYTEDARLLPPGGAAVSGKRGVEAFWKGVMGMGVRGVDLRTEHVEADGDLAYEIGSATLTIQPEGGSPVTDTVKYLVVWKREGGAWRLHADIWNANA